MESAVLHWQVLRRRIVANGIQQQIAVAREHRELRGGLAPQQRRVHALVQRRASYAAKQGRHLHSSDRPTDSLPSPYVASRPHKHARERQHSQQGAIWAVRHVLQRLLHKDTLDAARTRSNHLRRQPIALRPSFTEVRHQSRADLSIAPGTAAYQTCHRVCVQLWVSMMNEMVAA